MSFITAQIASYIEAATRFDDPLLSEMEQRAERERFPIIGPLVGPWLHFFTRLIGARKVYELGSGYGYSTWFFAKAVQQNLAQLGGSGEVVHTVWDAQLSADARDNMRRAGFGDLVRFIEGEALAALTAEQPGWDLIFMDIDKEGYPRALPLIEEKLRPGGLLIVDNLLWSGRVADDIDTTPATVAIREITKLLSDSPRWDFVLCPLRDGFGAARLIG